MKIINKIKKCGIRLFLYLSIKRSVEIILSFLFRGLWVGKLKSCGKNVYINYNVVIDKPSNISIGRGTKIAGKVKLVSEKNDENLMIGEECRISANVLLDYSGGLEVGDKTEFSQDVIVYTHDHGKQDYKEIFTSYLRIGKRVRFGARCIILPSVNQIGNNAIIAAGAVVAKSVKQNTIIGGVPGKEIGNVND